MRAQGVRALLVSVSSSNAFPGEKNWTSNAATCRVGSSLHAPVSLLTACAAFMFCRPCFCLCPACSMPGGESGADVLDRISSFFVTLFRFFQESDDCGPDTTVVIVSHGLTSRLFLSRFFHWSVETFEETLNLPNAGYVQMDRAERAAPAKSSTMPTEAAAARRGFCFRLTPDSVALLGLSEAQAHGRGGADAAACGLATPTPTPTCSSLPLPGAGPEPSTI